MQAEKYIRRRSENKRGHAGKRDGATGGKGAKGMRKGIELLRIVAPGTGLGILAGWLCYRSLLGIPAAVVVACLVIRSEKRRAETSAKRQMNRHFRDFLSSLHAVMRAGYSLENGVRQAAGELEQLYGKEDPLSLELAEILIQLSYGRPVEELFWELGKRSGLEDIRNFGEAVMITKRTGGDMARVLETAYKSVSGRVDAEQEIDTLIAAKRTEQQLLSLMPAAILLYMRLAFPDLLQKLYGNGKGIAVMTICLIIYLAAVLLARKMTEIEV